MIDSNVILTYENEKNIEYEQGYKKGYEDGFQMKIETINPSATEVLTFFFDMNNLNSYIVQDIGDFLQQKYPNNIVIGLPNQISFKNCTKEDLTNFIKMITKTIEQL